MTVICRAWITLKNGKRLYAAQLGKKGICFPVDTVRPKKQEPAKQEDPAIEADPT
jgi:hypothetical protein